MKNINKKMAICMLVLSMYTPVSALSKTETVYSKLNYNGVVTDTIVNELLVNDKELDTINDYSTLTDIINISDDNEFTNNNNKLTFNAMGKNVMYQGKSVKKLPITTIVTYKLDGKSIELNDLLGKSGNVTINIKYINNEKHGNLYTPFVITTTTMIESNNNSNVTINNGKTIEFGSKNLVVGISAPGLYESLNLEELKGLDTITINYDTKSFELSNIYSVVTTKLLESSDLSKFDKLDTLYESTSKLQDNMNLICKGSNTLSQGSTTLLTELKSSINTISKDKSNALSDEQISSITKTTLDTIDKTYTNKYKEAIANSAWEEVKKSMQNSSDKTVEGYVKEAVTNAVTNYIETNYKEDYDKCIAGQLEYSKTGVANENLLSCKVIEEVKNSNEVKLITEAALSASSSVANKTSMYIAENVSKSVSVNTSAETAKKTATMVSESVSKKVSNAVKDTILKNTISSLNELYTGISKLDSGIKELDTSLNAYNEQGINEISNIVNNNVKTLSNNVKELTKLANNYKSYGGSKTNGSTKFIMVIDSKKKEEEKQIVNKEETKLTLFQRIINLFK
ncbi:MAG: hypothetical protein PUJ60_02435 [bacterium]|nr:hypothetical protein [bacterium]MDY4108288.1 hypothetical protein [Bacilli bacterium]